MLQVTCECGWTCNAQRDELIRSVREHSERHHGRAAPSADEILAVALPVPTARDDGHERSGRSTGGDPHR